MTGTPPLVGTWRNQYGSDVVITDAADGALSGTFRTGIETSPFFGVDVPLTGVSAGDAVAFVCAAPEQDVVVSYTGKIEDGVLETLWIVLDGAEQWWSSATTNHDTFERVA